MFKLSKNLQVSAVGPARRLLIFLCNVLIIALVYNSTVQAAVVSDPIFLFAGAVNRSPTNPFVLPSTLVSSLPYNYTDSSATTDFIGTLNYYKFSLPVNLYFPTAVPSGTATFTANIKFNARVDVAQTFNNIRLYTDSPYVSVLSLRPYSTGGSISNEYSVMDIYIRFIDLPIDGVYSAQFNLDFYLEYKNNTLSSDPGYPRIKSYWYMLHANEVVFNFNTDWIQQGSVPGNVSDIADQIEKDRQEDRDNAGQAADDATDLVSNLDTQIKSKWEILWYPIEFTQSLLGVFTGSTARSISNSGVVGYTYNDQDGTLQPIYDFARSAVRATQGTTITFPAFSIMGMQVWDAYDYDLAQVKNDFPALFNAIYVVVSVLELYWFVGFLRDKYEEVFG